MGLLSFFRIIFSKKADLITNDEKTQLSSAPVTTPDPVVVDTPTVDLENQKRKRPVAVKKADKPKTQKKAIQKSDKK